ncbi:DEAD/DEAH box helicase [Tsukamurella tyrosinosolvens]|uniref:DEAD/DEAH box helicase n=1 Tax=Tsukamurella tyrosinosolvens TaxID=57704 RepID=UPI001E2FE78B|nr:DEAD/DEAH box helicase [Tsukamurella tyrosinosolvens]
MNPGLPSLPSLLAAEVQTSIVEYLTTTFALSDPAAQAALRGFLSDPETGIFRGPYLKIRTPYQPVGDGWVSPLEWMPHEFKPFRHQAEAFARLSTNGMAARPTIVTTGTGSGKTESFLVPLLDHCRRASARGERGIKAIILYPMNALVTDQARRLAQYLHGDKRLTGVTAGVYIGGTGKRRYPTPRRWSTTATHCATTRPTSCSPITACWTSCCCARPMRSSGRGPPPRCSTSSSTSSTHTTAPRAPMLRC